MKAFENLGAFAKILYWKSCRRDLRNILAHKDFSTCGLDFSEVEEFMDHNENGLALETLEYLLEEHDVEIGPELVAHINALRGKMGYPHVDNLGDKP